VMHAPSVTNTLLHACIWCHLLSIEVFGSLPMRQPPISWISNPGACLLSSTLILVKPALVYISVICSWKSFTIFSSLSSYAILMLSSGIPHSSFLSLLNDTVLVSLGIVSPIMCELTYHGPKSLEVNCSFRLL